MTPQREKEPETQYAQAQVEQIRSVDISRLSEKPTGTLPTDLMSRVKQALKLHLAL